MRCLTLAAAVLLLLVLAGASFALSSEPADALTPTPSYTPTFTATPVAGMSIAIDCDIATAGLQSACNLPLDSAPPYTIVDVVLYNNDPTSTSLAAFNFIIEDLDLARLDPPDLVFPFEGPCLSPHLDCNPNFNEADLVGSNWGCGLPGPTDDISPAAGNQTFMSCFNPIDVLPIAGSSSLRLARVAYNIPAGATAGAVPLDFTIVNAFDATGFEILNCTQPLEIGTCIDATITLVEPGPPSEVFTMAIDCDIVTVGIQSSCNVPLGTGTTSVDVYLINGTAVSSILGAFDVGIMNPDLTRLAGVTAPSCPGPQYFDCNPDFNQVDVTGTWFCGPPSPTPDFLPGPPEQSLLLCYDPIGDGVVLSAGGQIRLQRSTYTIPLGATTGSVLLSLANTDAYDEFFTELHSCNPVITTAGDCLNATINLVEAPTLTPTPTSTATPTSTPTPEGPRVEKQPEGVGDNADLSVPKANLWICETGSCAGPGEGALRVVEHAFGVQSDTDGDGIADAGDPCVCTGPGPDSVLGTADDTNPVAPPNTELGLGAYEFTVEYDNFVIQSVNPCDLVFGAGGEGSGKGPVEELGTSATNPDCAAEPSPTGSCAMSLVLENLVHFGCATFGQDQGPFGDFDLASLLLIPHPDLNNDLFPGNDNGVLTVIKDNGCELVDTLGHPVSGSVNGGLTPFCRDLAVTVRILEGDLDLNCLVDLTDAQLIASKYGAFFGGLLYSKWYDLEPALHDLDIDIKDVQKVFGRQGSECQAPIPAQPPLDPPTPFGD